MMAAPVLWPDEDMAPRAFEDEVRCWRDLPLAVQEALAAHPLQFLPSSVGARLIFIERELGTFGFAKPHTQAAIDQLLDELRLTMATRLLELVA